MLSFAETELLDACRVLFGSDLLINREFLYYIQPGGIKSAYRQRAKETHPDRFVDAAQDECARRTEMFRDVSQAYKLLDAFASTASKKLWPGADQRASFHRPAANPSAAQRYTSSASTSSSVFTLPKRHLEAGLFLYYRGVITYAEMIEALVWQRRQRPVIGTLAERWGWLKAGDVQLINRYHGRRGRFGARAVELGYLSSFQVQVLLRYQRQMQKRYGQYFVEQGMLSAEEIEGYIQEQIQHNRHYRAAHL